MSKRQNHHPPPATTKSSSESIVFFSYACSNDLVWGETNSEYRIERPLRSRVPLQQTCLPAFSNRHIALLSLLFFFFLLEGCDSSSTNNDYLFVWEQTSRRLLPNFFHSTGPMALNSKHEQRKKYQQIKNPNLRTILVFIIKKSRIRNSKIQRSLRQNGQPCN